MKTFGEYLFDFVEEVLEQHPAYSLKQLSVSAFESGFDYAVSFGDDSDPDTIKKSPDLNTIKKILVTDLETVDISSPDIPIAINIGMCSKNSSAYLNRRYFESLVIDEEEEAEEEQKPTKQKTSAHCCKHSCCCKQNKVSSDDDADLSDEEKEQLREVIRDFVKFLYKNADTSGVRTHCFGVHFPGGNGFPFV